MVPARLQAETGGAVGFVAMVMENVEFWTEGGGSDMALDAEAVYSGDGGYGLSWYHQAYTHPTETWK